MRAGGSVWFDRRRRSHTRRGFAARSSAIFPLVCCLLLTREAAAADPDRVEWSPDWPRVRWWEAVNAVTFTVADTLIESYTPIHSTTWRGGVLFDDWARNVFRGHSAATHSAASTVSDWLYKGGTLLPFIVDVFFVDLDVHESIDVSLQMFLIDMQSLSFAGILSLTAEHGAGRARPYTDRCGPDGEVRDEDGKHLVTCGTSNDNRSFFSGHATSVATMAGLTCAHHQHLPLYGGGLPDLAACLTMVGIAAGTGVLRLVYDEHWATDVVTAWAVGALTGYVAPSLLHYGFGDGRPIGEIRSGSLSAVPLAQVYPGGGGLGLTGVF